MFGLAVYLCVRAGERVSRDAVAAMFWPESEELKAKHSLRQMMYRLRQLGLDLDESSNHLYIAATRVDIDVVHFLSQHERECLPDAPPHEEPEFLRHFNSHPSDAFSIWIEGMRARVSSHARAAALQKLISAQREARWKDTLGWAELILRLDPLNEKATFARAEATALVGSKAQSLSILDTYVDEIGGKSEELGLRAAALRRRIYEKNADWGGRVPSETPLTGRETLMSRLSLLIEGAAGGHGGSIALVGPGGVGKSRLAEEAQAVAALHGFRCITIRTDSGLATRPLATTVHIAAALRDLPGAAGSPALSFPILSRLTRSSERLDALESDGHGDIPTRQLQWALGAVAKAVSEAQPLFISIEDAHHIDIDSWQSLASLLAATSRTRLAVVITGRALPNTDAPHSTLLRLNVPALSPSAALSLATHLARGSAYEELGPQLANIARASGGNPLFIRELLAHVAAKNPDKLPPSLQHVIDQRLGLLSPTHLRLLRLVSLTGELSTVARLQTLAGVSRSDVSTVLDSLESDGILSLTSSGVVLIHECWRTAVLDSTPAATLASLGLECAQTLSTDTSSDDQLDRLWLAAELYERAHDYRSARRQLVAAGRVLLARGIGRQAAEAYSRALSLRPDAEEAATLYERIAWSESQAGQFGAAVEAAQAGLSSIRTTGTGMQSLQLQLLSTLADALWREGMPHSQALSAIEALITHPHIEDSVRHYAALVALRLVYIDSADSRASHFVSVVRDSSSRSGPTLNGELARLIFASETGSVEDITSISESLTALSDLPQPPLLLAKAKRYHSAALRFCGRSTAAEGAAMEAVRMATELGQPDEAVNAMHALAFLHMDEGNLSAARHWLDEAKRNQGDDVSPASSASALHAEGRLLLQLGRYPECADHFAPHIDRVNADLMTRRRTVNLACIALAASECGQLELGLKSVDSCVRAIESDQPSFQVDFIVDTTVRALDRLGRNEDALSVGRMYCSRRASTYPLPIPKAFSRLSELYAASRLPAS